MNIFIHFASRFMNHVDVVFDVFDVFYLQLITDDTYGLAIKLAMKIKARQYRKVKRSTMTSCRFMLLPNYLISEISFIMPTVLYSSLACNHTHTHSSRLLLFSGVNEQQNCCFMIVKQITEKICRTFF